MKIDMKKRLKKIEGTEYWRAFKNLEVTSVRYFETRRGHGYECKTNINDISIWNDGMGGGTYLAFRGNKNGYPEFEEYTERDLEILIDDYEIDEFNYGEM